MGKKILLRLLNASEIHKSFQPFNECFVLLIHEWSKRDFYYPTSTVTFYNSHRLPPTYTKVIRILAHMSELCISVHSTSLYAFLCFFHETQQKKIEIKIVSWPTCSSPTSGKMKRFKSARANGAIELNNKRNSKICRSEHWTRMFRNRKADFSPEFWFWLL